MSRKFYGFGASAAIVPSRRRNRRCRGLCISLFSCCAFGRYRCVGCWGGGIRGPDLQERLLALRAGLDALRVFLKTELVLTTSRKFSSNDNQTTGG